MWPPNSPDLNLVDNATWGALQEKVYPSAKIYHSWATQVGNNRGKEKSRAALYWQKHNY